MLLWRVDLAKHEQEQHVIEAIETATYYKWPSKARKPEQTAGKDWTCRPAMLRGGAVMLAAAGRSGGVTTAITYDVRAGTSICERVLRISSNAIAIPSVGAKGTS